MAEGEGGEGVSDGIHCDGCGTILLAKGRFCDDCGNERDEIALRFAVALVGQDDDHSVEIQRGGLGNKHEPQVWAAKAAYAWADAFLAERERQRGARP